jgi:hypothetical protein
MKGDKWFFFSAEAVVNMQGMVGAHGLNNETKVGKGRIFLLKVCRELMKEYAYFWA